MGDFDIKACIMEMIGTFALCYVGGLSGPYLLNAALAHGFVLGFMIYVGAKTSGANFNPAVSLGLFLTGNLKLIPFLAYTGFQLLGGYLAGILCEFWATFFLAFAVYGTAVDARAAPGVFSLCIGASLTMSVLGIGAYTGAALNPARYFGPMLGYVTLGYAWNGGVTFWIYLVGPYLGAVAAMIMYKFLFFEKVVIIEEEVELEIKL